MTDPTREQMLEYMDQEERFWQTEYFSPRSRWSGETCTAKLGLVSAIRALIQSSRPAWQPIATAPKDGTDVLLWWPQECTRAVVGLWHVRGGDQSNAHWYSDVTDCSMKHTSSKPTHWMPLPVPPDAPKEPA